jgi:hypothetical protein
MVELPGAVNSVFTKLTFRFLALKRAYAKPEFENLAPQTGFGSIKIRRARQDRRSACAAPSE